MDQKAIYTPFYCEENIYKLNEQMLNSTEQQKEGQKVIVQQYVVIITNPIKQTHVRQQKSGNKANDYTVVWDYHVLFVKKITEAFKLDEKNHIKSSSQVYDFDSNLGFCVAFEEYFQKALKNPILPTWYRVVPGKQFHEQFASDRSHMINKTLKNGIVTYSKPQPDYECIKGGLATTSMNLLDYIDTENGALGQWYNQDAFEKFFISKST